MHSCLEGTNPPHKSIEKQISYFPDVVGDEGEVVVFPDFFPEEFESLLDVEPLVAVVDGSDESVVEV